MHLFLKDNALTSVHYCFVLSVISFVFGIESSNFNFFISAIYYYIASAMLSGFPDSGVHDVEKKRIINLTECEIKRNKITVI